MKINIPYNKLLKRMLVMEIAGERFYHILSLREQDANLRSVYLRLSLGEHQMAEYITKEMSLICKDDHKRPAKLISGSIKLISHLFSTKQLIWILRTVLKRKSYTGWFAVYKDNNRGLWDLLLAHEKMQFELLKIDGY